METEAQQELRTVLDVLADIERDIARHERSERPREKTELASLHQRLGLAKDRLAEKTWTSDQATKAIHELESRLSNLEQE